MTTTERDAIILPATGLTIFNTTLVAYQVNTGTPVTPVWSTLYSGPGSASLDSVATANGFAGTVTAPIITLTTTVSGMVRGNGTSLFSATPGVHYSLGTALNATGIVKSSVGTGALTTAVAADFPTLNQNTTGNAATVTTNANLTGPVTSVGNATTITNGVVTNAKLADMPANTIKGNNTGSTATPVDLTATQATAMLNTFTSALKGLVPLSGGGASDFLRADGTWQPLSGSGTNTGDVTIGTANGLSLAGQVLSLALASTSTIGALSSTDWNTFNNKGNGTVTNVSALTLGTTGTDLSSTVATGTTTPVITLNVPTASASNRGALSSTDWSTFNSKQAALSGTGYSKWSGSTPSYLTPTQVTADLNLFTTSLQGLVPGGGTAGKVLHGDGTWKDTTASTNQWSITGNTGTTSTTNFIGTIDNKSFKIKTNNTQGILLDSLGSVGIGTAPIFATSNPEKLLVDAGTTSYNVISGKGNLNNYLQLNIKNSNAGTTASSDVVATNDAGTEANGINYVDMGVNSSANTSTGVLGGANTGYLYATGSDFAIGNASSGRSLNFFTGGTASSNERMRIDSSGNVGIGTTTPSSKLHVNGTNPLTLTGVQTGANTDSLLTIIGGVVKKLSPSALTTSSSNAWALVGNAGTSATANFVGTTDSKSVRFRTNNVLRMIIDSSLGNVGIGTAAFDAAVPEKLLVNAGTNAVNGTYTPLTPINAIGFTNGYQQIQVQNRAWGQYSSSDLVAASDGTQNGSVPYNTDVHYVDLGINSSGYSNNNSNILNQPFTSYLYASSPETFLIGNGYSGKDIVFFTNYGPTNGSSTADGFELMRLKGGTNVATQQVTIGVIAPNGTNKLTVNGSISATAFNVSSDRRLKTNIKNLHYGLKEVLALAPVSYNWKTTPEVDKQIGLIAQDVRKEIPEIVSGNEETGTLSINYTELIPVLVNAIKEQQQQIDSLKKEVQLLKDKK